MDSQISHLLSFHHYSLIFSVKFSHHSSMVEHVNQTQASTSTQVDHVTDCLKAVEEYRGRQISKWDAIAQVSTAIASATASIE